MSGLKQRWEKKLLFTQHTEIAVVDVPLKMSKWMGENECAPAGQMSLNIPMKNGICWVNSGCIISITRHRLPPGVHY